MHEQKLVLAVENQRVANASTRHACIVGFSAARQVDTLGGGGGRDGQKIKHSQVSSHLSAQNVANLAWSAIISTTASQQHGRGWHIKCSNEF